MALTVLWDAWIFSWVSAHAWQLHLHSYHHSWPFVVLYCNQVPLQCVPFESWKCPLGYCMLSIRLVFSALQKVWAMLKLLLRGPQWWNIPVKNQDCLYLTQHSHKTIAIATLRHNCSQVKQRFMLNQGVGTGGYCSRLKNETLKSSSPSGLTEETLVQQIHSVVTNAWFHKSCIHLLIYKGSRSNCWLLVWSTEIQHSPISST